LAGILIVDQIQNSANTNLISNGVIAANTIGPSQLQTGTALSNIGTGGMDQSYLNATSQYMGFKNRIINGAMVIDQRNAGASVTPSTGWVYGLDRWATYVSQSSKLSVQQVSDAPTNFKNSLKVTSLSAYSITSGDIFSFKQGIEGFNFYDFNYGTASAASFTLSFWVKSSLTGTFGGALQNADGNRGYAFTYAVNAANTWEQKTVTVAGDQSGTWVGAVNTLGINIVWGLGVGATYSFASGSWGNLAYPNSATGATSVVGTSGATWQITGVQLEKGPTATAFDYRPYGTELQLCQRYFWNINGNYSNYAGFNIGWYGSKFRCTLPCPVMMRSAPTVALTGTAAGSFFTTIDDASYTNFTYTNSYGSQQPSATVAVIVGTADTVSGANMAYIQNNRILTISAEL
jgi:hypothetical protein